MAYLISGVDVPLVLVVAGGWQNEAENEAGSPEQSETKRIAQPLPATHL